MKGVILDQAVDDIGGREIWIVVVQIDLLGGCDAALEYASIAFLESNDRVELALEFLVGERVDYVAHEADVDEVECECHVRASRSSSRSNFRTTAAAMACIRGRWLAEFAAALSPAGIVMCEGFFGCIACVY